MKQKLRIPLPKAVATSVSVDEGQAVDLTIEDDKVVIRSRRPCYSIEELVADMCPGREPESFDEVHAPPVGRELV